MNTWHNSLANIILSLSAAAILGALIYQQQYYLAVILLIVGVFAFLFLQSSKGTTQTMDLLSSMVIQMQNRITYEDDVNRGVNPAAAHSLNQVPPMPPAVEPDEAILGQFGTGFDIPVKRVKGE